MNTPVKRPQFAGLGRGLSALLGESDRETISSTAAHAHATHERPQRTLPIAQLKPNPFQPRQTFEPEALDDLANSIREKGILTPILVRPVPGEPDQYQIVAGERRWRAAQKARLHEVPVVIKALNDSEALEYALIENIQRADLNAMEEARGYKQLIEKFSYTQDALGQEIGKSRSHIANTMRLLQLPPTVQDFRSAFGRSRAHARRRRRSGSVGARADRGAHERARSGRSRARGEGQSETPGRQGRRHARARSVAVVAARPDRDDQQQGRKGRSEDRL